MEKNNQGLHEISIASNLDVDLFDILKPCL